MGRSRSAPGDPQSWRLAAREFARYWRVGKSNRLPSAASTSAGLTTCPDRGLYADSPFTSDVFYAASASRIKRDANSLHVGFAHGVTVSAARHTDRECATIG